MKNFSERLKELMNENDIEVASIENFLELNNSSIIYDWINGKSTPRLNTLIRLANMFEVSTDYLLGLTENNEKVLSKQIPNFTSQLKRVLNEKRSSQYKLLKDKIVSRGHLNSWLNDNHTPSVENIVKIADYLNVSVDYLIGRQ